MIKSLFLDRKTLKELDFSIIITVILIVLFGAYNIATCSSKGNQQVKWLILSLAISYIVLLIDYVDLKIYVKIFYWLCMILLLYTLYFGRTINGATGWIHVGFYIQPAEIAKIALIMMLGIKLEDMEFKVNNIKNLIILGIYCAIPMVLIIKQPDMGMTMVLFFIVLGVAFAAKLNLKILAAGILIVIISVVGIWNSGHFIKDYQKGRIIAFLDPESYALGDGYQLLQAMTGVGSGGFFGKKFTVENQANANYVANNVPEPQTDFIFAVTTENFGTVGAIVLLSLYGFLIYRIIAIAKKAKDGFGMIFSVGMATYFTFAILQNAGMSIGIMPITGITLPLTSYGGSSLLTTVVSIALVLNIGMRRKKIVF
ncbi:rod shape-determining protein RodA [Clostridium zeae]|uniref:Rod shape-determining protein RodA n=1 Tax=Clostridium zeae TaxID=2759022 RepID=A0ABQ1EFF5_9CLOT|nr:FtsW/RodA/SpoVE family cell cycle protein [Clostridium zeae]GFZ33507.1 rod shape-determining protein RodA [Clostridium zeae]